MIQILVQFECVFPQIIKVAHILRENTFKMRPPAAVSNQRKRWSQNSAAAQHLRAGIAKGDIELSEQPNKGNMRFESHQITGALNLGRIEVLIKTQNSLQFHILNRKKSKKI